MDDYTLLIDLHKRAERQGPGGSAETRRAIELAGLGNSDPIKLADIGCGTGASTLLLAQSLNARITAVDFSPEFVEQLRYKAESHGLSNRISTLVCSMDNLPFDNEEYDVIWSEGAIYNMGFKKGVEAWKRFLKPRGLLVVSEITWITHSRPPELQQYWDTEYPEIDTASAKIGILENSGYSPIAYFVLPECCWLDNYYRPLQSSFPDFLRRQGYSQESQAIVASEEKEIALYERYKSHYSYGVYIARKLD